MANQAPNLFEYLDVTQFLNDVFGHRKSANSSFTYGDWANELAIGSKTVLRFILKKERRISSRSVELFKTHFAFNALEAEYFEALVAYSEARTPSASKAYSTTLIRIQRSRYTPAQLTPASACSHALAPAVLALLSFDDVMGSVAELSTLLGVSESEVSPAVESLVRAGAISTDSSGALKFNESGFRIHDSDKNIYLKNFHEYWIDRAKRSIDLNPSLRKFRALKFALSESDMLIVIEQINDFAISLLARFNDKSLNSRRLYMLETLLFPIANLRGDDISATPPSRDAAL